jgi:hypothetical protein
MIEEVDNVLHNSTMSNMFYTAWLLWQHRLVHSQQQIFCSGVGEGT